MHFQRPSPVGWASLLGQISCASLRLHALAMRVACCMSASPRFQPCSPSSFEMEKKQGVTGDTRASCFCENCIVVVLEEESERVLCEPAALAETRQKVTPEICPWTSFALA